MDDIFGGFIQSQSYVQALQLRNYLCTIGNRLTLQFNMSAKKTPLPAKAQVILGRFYDGVSKRVVTAKDKIVKYRERIKSMRKQINTTRKQIEKVHGCLN